MRIVFATGNEHKLGEIKAILKDTAKEIISMKDAGVFTDADETGTTFEENALIKARAVADALRAKGDMEDTVVLADDSGLVVDAMGGEPGIYSARFLGEDTPHSEKNKEILRRLEGVKDEDRSARFVCSVAAVFADGTEDVVRETFEGRIGHEIAGKNGFGYDPIFFLPEYGCTSAELTPEQKNSISHRGKAIREMGRRLQSL